MKASEPLTPIPSRPRIYLLRVSEELTVCPSRVISCLSFFFPLSQSSLHANSTQRKWFVEGAHSFIDRLERVTSSSNCVVAHDGHFACTVVQSQLNLPPIVPKRHTWSCGGIMCLWRMLALLHRYRPAQAVSYQDRNRWELPLGSFY